MSPSEPPFFHEIKRIQVLMAMLSCLPRGGKLHEVFGKALAIPHQEALARMVPCEDLSVDGLRDWLHALWSEVELTEGLQELVDWQQSGDNMTPAIGELIVVQEEIGFSLSFVREQ